MCFVHFLLGSIIFTSFVALLKFILFNRKNFLVECGHYVLINFFSEGSTASASRKQIHKKKSVKHELPNIVEEPISENVSSVDSTDSNELQIDLNPCETRTTNESRKRTRK